MVSKRRPPNQEFEKCKRICTELQTMADEKRQAAAFHALEALEATNQDAMEQRDKAIRLAAEATGCLESLNIVRNVMAMA